MKISDTMLDDDRGTSLVDYVVFPFFIVGMYVSAATLLAHGVPPLWVTPIVIGPFAALAALLERIRPERAAHVPLDQPLWIEAFHFIFSFELGYGLSLLVIGAFERVLTVTSLSVPWPASLPTVLQVCLAIALYELLSYWQHRLIHRAPGLFRFHALHHSGERLNFVRVIRFHAVDIATASVAAYLPLVVLGAPEPIITLMVAELGALGILQHANIRMRTPAWLDRIVCTPAVHRHHHSLRLDESDRNFANTFMIFDIVFGTYGVPRADGPEAVGIDNDPVPRDAWGQIVSPFRADASPATQVSITESCPRDPT